METIEIYTSIVLPDEDGIECDTDVVVVCTIDYYLKVEGSYSYNAPSDMDYYGYEELDYTVDSVYLDNSKMDTKIDCDFEQFNNEKFNGMVEEAVRESRSE